jgi:polyisoprenoid-binding protein YceI
MKRIFFTSCLLLSMGLLFAQDKYRATNTNIKMEGTSTMHDWHMVSEQGISDVIFNFDGQNLAGMPSLTFTVQAETLKSGTKGLNKNAYKALNTDKYPSIGFASNYATVHSTGVNSYLMSVKGKLTISGVSKDVWVSVACKINADQSIQATGSLKLKMTDYSLVPPSFMFGAMKTGDEVTIKFTALLTK